jgi:Ca2+-binding EF-hand superfamily protein
MKRMLAILALCIVMTAANAQTSTQPMSGSPRAERAMQQLQTRFMNANVTHDGKLTREQAAAGMPMVAKHFDEIDTQKAGYLTLPQIAEYMSERAMSH